MSFNKSLHKKQKLIYYLKIPKKAIKPSSEFTNIKIIWFSLNCFATSGGDLFDLVYNSIFS